MLDFGCKMLQGALCWTDKNDYLIVPKDLYFDFCMMTRDALLETQRINYVPSEHKTYSVLIRLDGRPAVGYPVENQYVDIYKSSIWIKHPDVTMEEATLITDPHDIINR